MSFANHYYISVWTLRGFSRTGWEWSIKYLLGSKFAFTRTEVGTTVTSGGHRFVPTEPIVGRGTVNSKCPSPSFEPLTWVKVETVICFLRYSTGRKPSEWFIQIGSNLQNTYSFTRVYSGGNPSERKEKVCGKSRGPVNGEPTTKRTRRWYHMVGKYRLKERD